MFQYISAKENISTNLCYGIPFENFSSFVESHMAREFNKISYYNKPTIIYIIIKKLYSVFIVNMASLHKNNLDPCGLGYFLFGYIYCIMMLDLII